MRVVLFVVEVMFSGVVAIVVLRVLGAVVILEMWRILLDWLVLTIRTGIQVVGMEKLDKAEHAELRESGLEDWRAGGMERGLLRAWRTRSFRTAEGRAEGLE